MKGLQGYFAHEKQPPPQDHHMTLGIVLLQVPRRGVFLMSESRVWPCQASVQTKYMGTSLIRKPLPPLEPPYDASYSPSEGS